MLSTVCKLVLYDFTYFYAYSCVEMNFLERSTMHEVNLCTYISTLLIKIYVVYQLLINAREED